MVNSGTRDVRFLRGQEYGSYGNRNMIHIIIRAWFTRGQKVGGSFGDKSMVHSGTRDKDSLKNRVEVTLRTTSITLLGM